jgi:hypothetical protein
MAQPQGNWRSEVDGCDVVINLTGRSVNCRYTAANREEILQSRVLSTRVVGQAIATAVRKPHVWLHASTATIYAHRYDSPNDEHSGILGGAEPSAADSWRFSIDVARAWERAFEEAGTDGTRKIALRSAMTWSPDPGGVLDTLLGLARHGLGGSAGSRMPCTRLIFGVLGAIAEFERERIRERVLAGLQRATAQGVKLGRPQKAASVLAVPGDSVRCAARMWAVSNSTAARCIRLGSSRVPSPALQGAPAKW